MQKYREKGWMLSNVFAILDAALKYSGRYDKRDNRSMKIHLNFNFTTAIRAI